MGFDRSINGDRARGGAPAQSIRLLVYGEVHDNNSIAEKRGRCNMLNGDHAQRESCAWSIKAIYSSRESTLPE